MDGDSIRYDVVVVGGGPAGLAAAIRLRQLAAASDRETSVCLLEKGAEIGAHTLSGAVIETRALDELLPDWEARATHTGTAVTADEFHLLRDAERSVRLPSWLVPASMHNAGNRIMSLGRLCHWLGQEAERLGVDVFAGYPAAKLLRNPDGAVAGIATADAGRNRDGSEKATYEPGIEIGARYVILAEGARGHLTQQLIGEFGLDRGRDPQHYGIGIKELWQIDPARHREGLVVHGAGWPLAANASGGFFAYHASDSTVAVGLIVDLNYRNPWLDPYRELQRLKHHPAIATTLEGGERIAYGARAITKGGLFSLPALAVPGAVLAGCCAGTLNYAKIKGSHTAMKSGSIAAECVFAALAEDRSNDTITELEHALAASWVGDELRRSRNFGPALHRLGLYAGGAFNLIDQSICGGRLPVTLKDPRPDNSGLRPAEGTPPIEYPRPDNTLSFDRMASVYLSGTHHEEDQPCHLKLADPALAVDLNLIRYAGPEARYCPAGVYEFVDVETEPRLQINAQNCLHCKVCDIKDPRQNIVWTPPEPGGGPLYNGM